MNETRNYLITILVILLVTLSCLAATSAEDELAKLKWLDTADPIEDAHLAIKTGDLRLRAVFGYSLIVPGIRKEEYSKFRKKIGFNPIEGTSDYILNEEHMRLNRLAYDYALRYNQVILNSKTK